MLRFPINQTPRNESEDASTQEISPVDIAYTVLEVLSEACLAVVIITYIATERRKTMAGKLMINFCLALMLLYIESTCNKFISAGSNVSGCLVIAVLGHWLVLSMFIGLASYTFWLYLKIAWVFTNEPRHYALKTVLATWVAPLLIVSTSVAPDYQKYHRTKHLLTCKAHGYAFYLGLISPSLLLVLFSVVVMILSIRAMCKSHAKLGSQPADTVCNTYKLKRRMTLFLCLLMMAVVGWGSALVAADDTVPFSVLIIAFVLFLVCGFGQGVFIFCFTCICNSKVRRNWLNLLLYTTQFTPKSSTSSSS